MISLAEYLKSKCIVRDPRFFDAFKMIDRRDFLPDEQKNNAEFDYPLPIGYGQTNSQPATVAVMLESLDPLPGNKMLDVGCGSGWTTALLAYLAGEKGKVYGIEIIGDLADFARKNVGRYDFIESGRVAIFQADGYEGLLEYGPYDRILVSAAAEKIPVKLIEQLSLGGRMVIPIGKPDATQYLAVLEKDDHGKTRESRLPGYVFVPLIKKSKPEII